MSIGKQDDHNEARRIDVRLLGRALGPMLAIAIYLSPLPTGLSTSGWTVCAVTVLMAVWWMTEALPLAATALTPLVLFPLLQVSTFELTARAYAHPLIFLLLGGFLMARAIESHGLSRRLAYRFLKSEQLDAHRIIASVMLVTAFLSMWVSNTATAMMMLPVAQSIISGLKQQCDGRRSKDVSNFSTALLLGVAYSATIGGIGTLIGTPPNALFAAYMRENHGVNIGFLEWMQIGIPIVFVLLPLAWWLLSHQMFKFTLPAINKIDMEPSSTQSDVTSERNANRVLWVVGIVALSWISRPLLDKLFVDAVFTDAGIAIAGALALFLFPAVRQTNKQPRATLLTWEMAASIKWEVLILFGGGLALADAITGTGVAVWTGSLLKHINYTSVIWLICVTGTLTVLIGELASNTATAAIFLPIVAGIAVSFGLPPTALALPVALAATIGFMLPVATPPNAIIFGSGMIKIKDMVRAGAVLDVLGTAIVLAFATTLR